MGYNLKSVEEVQEYLKNLHLEYQFGCLSEKNPEACHLLGDYQESVETDFKKAVKTYKENCDERNYGKSCGKYGGYAIKGKGLEKIGDVDEAYRYMKKGCEYGDPISCTYAGILATTPLDMKNNEAIDFKLGMEMLRKSCSESKIEKACFHLSTLYLNGVPGYAEKNLQEAYKASLIACDLRNPYACANVSQMYARGEGIQKDPELARIFKNRALEIDREIKQNRTFEFQRGAN